MPADRMTPEDKERWSKTIEAIDEGLDSDDMEVVLQAAMVWAFVDIADSLDVISQHFEAPEPARPAKKARKTARKTTRRPRQPVEVEPEEEEEPDGEEEEDEEDDS